MDALAIHYFQGQETSLVLLTSLKPLGSNTSQAHLSQFFARNETLNNPLPCRAFDLMNAFFCSSFECQRTHKHAWPNPNPSPCCSLAQKVLQRGPSIPAHPPLVASLRLARSSVGGAFMTRGPAYETTRAAITTTAASASAVRAPTNYFEHARPHRFVVCW